MTHPNTKEKHVHDFKPATQKVMAAQESKLGFIDTLKQFKCKCGAVETVDLERKLL